MRIDKTSTRKLDIALIGAGKMGQHHISAIDNSLYGRLVAIADPLIDKFDRSKISPEVHLFQNPEDLFNKLSPDVVHVTTPPNTHADLAFLALKNGSHVYVEKPFCLCRDDAENILQLSDAKHLKVCAGHQLLKEAATQKIDDLLPTIGTVHHVESYFSFRQVRRNISSVDQLIDILPHPLYLLLHFMGCDDSLESISSKIKVDPSGELRAILRKGNTFGNLIVSLNARPIESYVRIKGSSGSIWADFILGSHNYIPGTGVSAPSIILKPFQEAIQLISSTTRGVFNLLTHSRNSYPGLQKLADSFYESILYNLPAPTSPQSINNTVSMIEKSYELLSAASSELEMAYKKVYEERSSELAKPQKNGKSILVTGGTGFLGSRLVKLLLDRGNHVLCPCRQLPSYDKRLPGVDYFEHDLSVPLIFDPDKKIETIIHCAAETSGGFEDHQKNSVQATENLLQFAIEQNVSKFIFVSSVAVLKQERKSDSLFHEDSPVDFGNLSRGPYVWGKAESEKRVLDFSNNRRLEAKIIRLAPLVDFDHFSPPGRLGREIGPFFIAVGPKNDSLSLCDVSTAASVLELFVHDHEKLPSVLNLVEPSAPTRKQLLQKVVHEKPYLKPFWLPSLILKTISPIFVALQKIFLKSNNPVDIYSAFATFQYDTFLSSSIISKLSR